MSKKFKFSKGFTLVELLVVIGVIGILAAGLLAAVDPLEQFRKGNDANSKTAGAELVQAIQRYYATRGAFPWHPIANSGSNCLAMTVGTPVPVTSFNACTAILISLGELKSSYTSQTSILRNLLITDITPAASPQDFRFSVCFDPQSKADSNNLQNTRFNSAGVPTSGGTFFCLE